jgi:hypothetical protein
MASAFFKNIDELKIYYPAWSSFNFSDIEPTIEMAEERYILPVLGEDEFENLRAAYVANNSNPAVPYKALLHKVRLPLADFAYKLHIPRGNVNITSTGIFQEHTQEIKPAFQWAVADLKKSLAASSFDKLDFLYSFLFKNKSDYPDWVSTGNYSERTDLFIRNASEFTKVASLIRDSHLNYLNMVSAMRRVEDFNIVSTIGDDMVATLKAELLTGSVSPVNQKLINLIVPAVAWLTLADSVQELPITIDAEGLSVLPSNMVSDNIEQRNNPSEEKIHNLKKKWQSHGNAYKEKLRKFINANHSDYPDFENSELYIPNVSIQVENPSTGSFMM